MPADTSSLLHEFVAEGLANIVGCCGTTTPEHISAIREAVAPLGTREVQQREVFYREAA